ncbi:MAG: 2-deoxy-D-gluconate 3-dehydrogenase [Planctomycetota bacterium]|nr:MAG: 2-deoxy-D-gluconate 3-dehydrogenase [Planctomycetota bacterium]
MKFENDIAFISGGLGDIGHEIALQLAKEGAHISVADIQEETSSKELENKVIKMGRKFLYVKADLSKAKNVKQWHQKTIEKIGVPNLIIYSSAIVNKVSSFMEVSEDTWDLEINVNLNSAFYISKVCSQALIKNNLTGRIVLIGSWAGHRPHLHIPTYSVAKAGLRMFCQCIAKELAPKGIIVNELAPGYVDAGLSGKFFKENPESRESARERVPNQLLISSAEVAEYALYLCDPKNKHMVGSTLLMDGGLSI